MERARRRPGRSQFWRRLWRPWLYRSSLGKEARAAEAVEEAEEDEVDAVAARMAARVAARTETRMVAKTSSEEDTCAAAT